MIYLVIFMLLLVMELFFFKVVEKFNIMDRINGITGLYKLSMLGTLGYVNQYVSSFVQIDFIVYSMIASIVFLIFNYLKKAKCIAGDIGSIAIAFWIVYLLIKLYLFTGCAVWLIFLSVYVVETALTMIHRTYLKVKLSEAHRRHYYQILVNEYKIYHRIVSL